MHAALTIGDVDKAKLAQDALEQLGHHALIINYKRPKVFEGVHTRSVAALRDAATLPTRS